MSSFYPPLSLLCYIVNQPYVTSSYLHTTRIQHISNTNICFQVLDEYFKRSDAMRTNFVQVKGFNLLVNQLKQYAVSFELLSALGSIVVGQEINLKRDQ